MYYEVPQWADYIPEQIERYEQTRLRGFALPALITTALWLTGLAALFYPATAPDNTVRWIVVTLSIMTIGFTLLLTPLEWQRYYMPVLAPALLIVAFGLRTIGQLGYTRLFHKQSVQTPSHEPTTT